MGTLATILVTAAGLFLVLMAIRDVFDVLFHEMGRAVLSHAVIRGVWRPFHVVGRRRRGLFTPAGPLALIAVVWTWAILLILGAALIYWPHMPEGFNYGSGVGSKGAFLDSVYLSVTTLATL